MKYLSLRDVDNIKVQVISGIDAMFKTLSVKSVI